MENPATTIRSLDPNELPAASLLIERVFAEFIAPHYSRQGIETFRRFIAADRLAEQLRSGAMRAWGALRADTLLGVVVARSPGHISLLFVDKSVQRQGIARALFNRLLGACTSDPAIDRITVNSSPNAVEMYRRLGFTATDAARTVDGIRYTPMAYRIK